MLVVGLLGDSGRIDPGDWKTFRFPLDVLSQIHWLMKMMRQRMSMITMYIGFDVLGREQLYERFQISFATRIPGVGACTTRTIFH